MDEPYNGFDKNLIIEIEGKPITARDAKPTEHICGPH